MTLTKPHPSNGFTRLAILFLLATPVAFYSHGNTGIVFADVVSVLGLILFCRYLLRLEAFFLATTIAVSTFICITYIFIRANSSIYPLGSLVFFLKPCFAYFSALFLIRSGTPSDYLFSRFSLLSSISLISIIGTISYHNGGVVRADSHLNGSIFGLEIFGSYGVNSLAIFFSLCSYAAAYPLMVSIQHRLRPIFLLIGIGFAYLALMSLSRAAALGLILMWGTLILLQARQHPFRAILFLVLSSAGTLHLALSLNESDMLTAKTMQIQKGLASGDIDSISSGRLSLYYAAVIDVLNNPLAGSAFQGFSAGADNLRQFDELSGLSPHNQYITTVWKMGLIAAAFYFLMLLTMILKSLRNCSECEKPWLIGFLLGTFVIFCNTWDVLMIPNVGALVFFTLGAFASKGSNR